MNCAVLTNGAFSLTLRMQRACCTIAEDARLTLGEPKRQHNVELHQG